MTDWISEGLKMREERETKISNRVKTECKKILVESLGAWAQEAPLPEEPRACIQETENRISSFIGPLFAHKKVAELKRQHHMR
ncbi:MAG: hypothetical protein ACQESG_04125 [Nanobdellota archaeon]